ncbi:MAG: TlpA family protein disulfide reductase [Betaproteobacteria bacterium]|nr:TlpA family protein disulfide reductase [Betaproteobacteria bacterium]
MSRGTTLAIFVVVGALALSAGFFLNRSTLEVDVPLAAPANNRLLTTPIKDLEGQPRRVGDWTGKVIVVNFWAAWCAPCREEIPALIRAQTRFGAKGLQVIGIALDDLGKVTAFAQEIGINYPTLVAGIEGLSLAEAAGNDKGALPFTVYFDRTGNPVKAELGGVDDAKLAARIEPLL